MRRHIGWIITIGMATVRPVIILLIRIYPGRLPVWRYAYRAWIGNSRRRHIRVTAVTPVGPVHPRVITVNLYNIALLQLRLWVTCRLCQFNYVIVIYGSANISVAVGNTRIRVGIFISHSINYSSGARPVVTGRAHNRWPEYVYRVVTDNRPAIGAVVNVIYPYRFARVTANLFGPWAAYVGNIIIYVSVIDDRSLVYHINDTRARYIITVNVWAAYICLRHANPVIVGHVIIVAKRYADTDTRPKRSPGIVAAAAAPVNPGGPPFVTGYPFPAVIIVKTPAAIMEGCPSPRIIGHPGIAIRC